MPGPVRKSADGNQFEKVLGQGDRLNDEVKMADLFSDMQGATKKHSRSGSLFNSNEYNDVQSALGNVVFLQQENFTNDVSSNEKMITNAIHDYYKLLAACERYIKKSGGVSRSGRARKEKVKQIQNYAQRDITGIEQVLYAMKSMSAEEQATLNWDEILNSARMETIEVENYDSLTSLGAAAKTGDDAGKLMKEGVFAPNKNVNLKDVKGPSIASDTNTMVDEELNKKLQSKGMKTNMANRNVATSRVANLIGLGDLVAQSTLVSVKDKATGQKREGSLMALAKGNEMNSEIQKNVMPKMRKVDDLAAREEKAKEMIAPSLQKELSSLQVLDYLCGQGDRHRGNYFVTQDGNGRFEHLQGIDNDLSFSSGVDNEKQLRDTGRGAYLGGMNWRMVVDSNDNIMIPHMDQKLADNILKLNGDELRFVLKDLLEDVFIEQTIARLRKLQNGIKKEQDKGTSNVFVKEGGWGKDTLDDFINKSSRHHLDKEREGEDLFKGKNFYYTNNKNNYEYSKNDSYVSVLISDMMGYSQNDAYYLNNDKIILNYACDMFKKRIGKEAVAKRTMENFGLTKEELLKVPDIKKYVAFAEDSVKN